MAVGTTLVTPDLKGSVCGIEKDLLILFDATSCFIGKEAGSAV